MDDEKIIERGGDEYDIERYANQNGANLTETDVWAEHKAERKEKKQDNEKKSIARLVEAGFEVQTLNPDISHYRVRDYNFWPTTGKFHNQKTGLIGRGVFNLIKQLKADEYFKRYWPIDRTS